MVKTPWLTGLAASSISWAGDLPSGPHDFPALTFPGLRYGSQEFPEGRQAMAWFRGEVGTPVKWLQGRGQENRHRPATLTRQRHHGRHVNAVQVGSLLAVNLDVNEMVVHERGGFGVLEQLVRHHVTPVTGCVADAQEDGFFFAARFFQRFRSPRVPVNRVFGVLQKVG